MIKLFLSALIFVSLLCNQSNAQTTDTLKQDSLKLKTSYALRQNVGTYIVPAGLIAAGALSFRVNAIRNLDQYVQKNIADEHHKLINHYDDYFQYMPTIAVYGLNAFGIKGKHSFADRTATYLLAEGLMASSTWFVKHQTDRQRPNDYDRYSFPSGHVGTAFVSAEFLSQEYGDISPWYTVGGYTFAVATAALRVRNNYHLLSDVVAGAGIGMASAKLAYLAYPLIKRMLLHKKALKITLMPAYQEHRFGFYLGSRF